VEGLLSIGRFARLTGLSIGALRHYDEIDLLRPAHVDADTGYRSYSVGQLPQARAIQRLRALDLSLEDIRDVLNDEDATALEEHARRVEARIWRLQRIQHRLRHYIERKDDLMAEPETMDVDHRRLGVDLFNYTWTFLEKENRTRDEEDEMLFATHASAYHWLHAEGAQPQNRARGEWQIARVYAVLERGEPAIHHAQRCLDHCQENGIGDWDLAFAYEALARAHKVAGNDGEFRRNLELAREAGAKIADAEDRELLEKDVDELAAA
jgi:DNA-binding transcriptional MerR regulator